MRIVEARGPSEREIIRSTKHGFQKTADPDVRWLKLSELEILRLLTKGSKHIRQYDLAI